MTEHEICEQYQRLIRQSYPQVIVKRIVEDWVPFDDVYHAFFIPDEAAGEYLSHWLDENGWGIQAEDLALPKITLIPTYASDTKTHYAHLFPEVFGKTASAQSKRGKSKPVAKRSKPRVSQSRTLAASK